MHRADTSSSGRMFVGGDVMGTEGLKQKGKSEHPHSTESTHTTTNQSETWKDRMIERKSKSKAREREKVGEKVRE